MLYYCSVMYKLWFLLRYSFKCLINNSKIIILTKLYLYTFFFFFTSKSVTCKSVYHFLSYVLLKFNVYPFIFMFNNAFAIFKI